MEKVKEFLWAINPDWVIFIALFGISAFFVCAPRCSYLQQKTYTEPGTSERAFELCIKSQIEKSTAGGNVQHCQEIQDNFTTAGKQRNFERCFQHFVTNQEKIKALYIEYSCYKIVYGERK